MDRMGRLSGSAEIADDDAYQESLARLSHHLATRRPTHVLPDPLPPPKRSRPWSYVLLIVIAAAIAYPSYQWLTHDGVPRPATPRIVATAAAPAPVLASIAATPAAPPDPPAKVQPATLVDLAAAIPPPPSPAPPVTSSPPEATAAPQPDVALTRAEIVEIQKRLAALGFNPGQVDGVIGRRTVVSAQAYEARLGRTVTDKIDRNLLVLLRQNTP
jgi:hypothetical protein